MSKNAITRFGLENLLKCDTRRMCKGVKSVNRFSVRATPKLTIKYVPVSRDDWVSIDGTVVFEPKLVDKDAINPSRIRARTKGVTNATATS
jgi:hypothetical protein